MRMVGHRTESIYRRYAILDEAMMRDGAEKLAMLHALDRAAIAAKSDSIRRVVSIGKARPGVGPDKSGTSQS